MRILGRFLQAWRREGGLKLIPTSLLGVRLDPGLSVPYDFTPRQRKRKLFTGSSEWPPGSIFEEIMIDVLGP